MMKSMKTIREEKQKIEEREGKEEAMNERECGWRLHSFLTPTKIQTIPRHPKHFIQI
jgi:hypothetical protein